MFFVLHLIQYLHRQTKTNKMDTLLKNRLNTRTTEELISDAKVALLERDKELNRRIAALAMDIVYERVSEEKFETIFNDVYGI